VFVAFACFWTPLRSAPSERASGSSPRQSFVRPSVRRPPRKKMAQQQDESDEEKNSLSIGVAAVWTLLVGMAGVSFGITGAVLFPFVPSTVAGSILAVTSALTLVAALLVLCGRDTMTAAHRAVIASIVIQIASCFLILVMTVGTRHTFCAAKKPCYVEPILDGSDDKCDKDRDGKGCIADLSYFCHKASMVNASVVNASMVYLGRRNCDTTLSDRCNGGRRYWGFDDRDDCLDFYVQKNRIMPDLSYGFIVGGGVLQFVFSTLLSTALRARF